MKNRKNRKPRRRMSRPARITLLVVCIMAFFVADAILVQIWFQHKIESLAEQASLNLGDDPLNVDIGRVRVNIAAREIALLDVTVQSVRRPASSQRGPGPTVKATFDRLAVGGIDYRRGRRGGKPALRLGRITLSSPRIEYSGVPQEREQESDFNMDSLRVMVLGNFRYLSVRRIEIDNGNIDFSYWATQDKRSVHVDGLGFKLTDLEIDSETDGSESTLSNLNVGLVASNITYRYKNQAVEMNLTALSLDSEAGTFYLGYFGIVPQLPKDSFAARVYDHSDWTHVEIQDVTASNLKLSEVEGGSLFSADSLLISSGHVESYKNRQIPQQQERKPLIHETLQQLPVGIAVNHVRAKDFYIQYDELAVDAVEKGSVFFIDVEARIDSLTNRPVSGRRDYTMYASGNIYGHAKLETEWVMPVSAETPEFTVSASLKSMNIAHLNKIITPMEGLQIRNGQITGMEFTMNATPQVSNVDLHLTYNSLDVALIRQRTGETRKLLTFIANGFVVKESNPDRRGLRTANTTVQRDPYKTEFNYVWISLAAGIQEIVI